MCNLSHNVTGSPPEPVPFYRDSLRLLNRSRIPFMVGGAYALSHYTGIERDTKDLDVFVRPGDCPSVLQVFAEAGYRTQLTFPHWLGKIFHDDYFIDVIFSSGNGVAEVDEKWLHHAEPCGLLGQPVRISPVEEMIWSKGYIMERERFDGADIAHLLRVRGADLDWPRLLRRFGPHWRVLLSHLVLFGFIYPGERDKVPEWVVGRLLKRMAQETASEPARNRLCQGTLLSRAQYLPDVEKWGYEDARKHRAATCPAKRSRRGPRLSKRERVESDRA
jgi:hypothetical protein